MTILSAVSGFPILPGPYAFTARAPFERDIYHFFLQSVRDADAAKGDLLLYRWLRQMQVEWEDLYRRILSLLRLHDVENTSAEALGHLKWLVGLSGTLDFLTGGLSEEELRRLVSVAVGTWKRKGTEYGLQLVLETVTADEVRIDDWFDLRVLLEEWEIGRANLGGADLWLLDKQAWGTGTRPDSVTWDGTALHLDLTTLLRSQELVNGSLGGTFRAVRVRCLPSRVTEDAVWTTDVLGNLSATVTGPMGQTGTPSTSVDDYRAGIDLAEYSLDVRVPDNGGVVNRTLVEGLIRVLRPALERVFVRYVTFLDSFRRTPRWAVLTGDPPTYDPDAGTVTLADVLLGVDPAIETDETGDLLWAEYLLQAQLQLSTQAIGAWGEIRFLAQDADNFYALRLAPSGTIGVTLSLDRVVAAARVTLDSAILPIWYEGVDYVLQVDVNGSILRGYLDGDRLLEAIDATFAAGRVALACDVTQVMTVTYVEVAEHEIEEVRIGPPLSGR